MLHPAKLYEDELNKKHISTWYDDRYQYYHGICHNKIDIYDNDDMCRQFVSVDEQDNVIGFISYNIDWSSRNCYHFSVISYDINNKIVIKDTITAILDIFYKYKFNRLEFRCYDANPVARSYNRFIKNIGGNFIGIAHEIFMCNDGKLHNQYLFEILKHDINIDYVRKLCKRFKLNYGKYNISLNCK